MSQGEVGGAFHNSHAAQRQSRVGHVEHLRPTGAVPHLRRAGHRHYALEIEGIPLRRLLEGPLHHHDLLEAVVDVRRFDLLLGILFAARKLSRRQIDFALMRVPFERNIVEQTDLKRLETVQLGLRHEFGRRSPVHFAVRLQALLHCPQKALVRHKVGVHHPPVLVHGRGIAILLPQFGKQRRVVVLQVVGHGLLRLFHEAGIPFVDGREVRLDEFVASLRHDAGLFVDFVHPSFQVADRSGEFPLRGFRQVGDLLLHCGLHHSGAIQHQARGNLRPGGGEDTDRKKCGEGRCEEYGFVLQCQGLLMQPS